MSHKNIKTLAILIATILYSLSLLVVLALVYTGLSSIIGLISNFNLKDLVAFLLVVIFFYWIIKTS